MNTGYLFTATCPRCGTPLEHQADGVTDVTSAQAVAHCPACVESYILRLTMQPVGVLRPDRNIKPHPVVATILAHEGKRKGSVYR